MLPKQPFAFEVVTVDRCGKITQRDMHQAWQFVQDLGNGVTLDMVALPGGTFQMGSPAREGYDDERPQHRVALGSFLMGKYLVTQEQWAVIMGARPCRFEGARRPAVDVSWDDAGEFCRRLSKRSGQPYRLPSEAEWEYACRAGTSTPFYCGVTITTELANYVGEYIYRSEPKGVYRHKTTEVGSFPPNAFGLYDMPGNVWEWCADAWHDNYQGAPTNGSVWDPRTRDSHRLVRGGSWHEPPDLCRSAARLKRHPSEGDDFIGFRVALEGTVG